jgi:competence ComEA-like helix-hairpin-helix protein
MKWRDFAKDYLNFSRKERVAVIFLVAVILVTLILPEIIPAGSPENPTPDTSWFSVVKKLEIKDSRKNRDTEDDAESPSGYQFDKRKSSYAGNAEIKGELFYFDPNKASADVWRRLGLREKTVQTIQNFLNKGGKFKRAEDLQKIYGLRPEEFDRLLPYISIEQPDNKQFAEVNSAFTKQSPEPTTYSKRLSAIDINSADTAAFISLPGIGSKLASRIVNFRDKLGGFYSIDQIGETYGLPDSTFQKIKPFLKLDNSSVKKININTATVDELKAHPYIKFSLANPIVAYRNEHGPFSKLDDLKKVLVVSEEIYDKVFHYLTIE